MSVSDFGQISCTPGTFMQDSTSCHTAKIIKQWFEWGFTWPESKGHNTSSVPKLEAAVKGIWNDIRKSDKRIIQNLALSVSDCLSEVIAHKGR